MLTNHRIDGFREFYFHLNDVFKLNVCLKKLLLTAHAYINKFTYFMKGIFCPFKLDQLTAR